MTAINTYYLRSISHLLRLAQSHSNSGADDDMFRTVIINATSIHKEGRLTAELRAVEVAKLVNESEEPWLVWCNTNYEADALKGLIPNAVDLRGSDTVEKKESSLEGFIDGSIRVLITK